MSSPSSFITLVSLTLLMVSLLLLADGETIHNKKSFSGVQLCGTAWCCVVQLWVVVPVSTFPPCLQKGSILPFVSWEQWHHFEDTSLSSFPFNAKMQDVGQREAVLLFMTWQHTTWASQLGNKCEEFPPDLRRYIFRCTVQLSRVLEVAKIHYHRDVFHRKYASMATYTEWCGVNPV